MISFVLKALTLRLGGEAHILALDAVDEIASQIVGFAHRFDVGQPTEQLAEDRFN